MNYERKVWKENSRVSAGALNNIEQGIENCVKAINSIPSWALQKNKPKYTAEELGISGSNALEFHNLRGDAHQNLFDKKADKDELEEIRKSITSIKSSLTKLRNELKELKQSIDEG